MTLSHEYFRSICDLWIILAVCFTGLVALTILTFRRYRRMRSLRRLGRAQHGASYSISMVVTMPIYAMLLCMIAECTLTLQVKIGTMYSAYAAARSATVWYPAEMSRTDIERKVKTAAVQAIMPFASSWDNHLQGIAVGGSGDTPEVDDLHEAYAAYCGGPITDACLSNKPQ